MCRALGVLCCFSLEIAPRPEQTIFSNMLMCLSELRFSLFRSNTLTSFFHVSQSSFLLLVAERKCSLLLPCEVYKSSSIMDQIQHNIDYKMSYVRKEDAIMLKCFISFPSFQHGVLILVINVNYSSTTLQEAISCYQILLLQDHNLEGRHILTSGLKGNNK